MCVFDKDLTGEVKFGYFWHSQRIWDKLEDVCGAKFVAQKVVDSIPAMEQIFVW